MKPKAKIRLGDLLVQEGIISEEQLMQTLSAQKQSGRKLGYMLIELGFMTENQLLTFFYNSFFGLYCFAKLLSNYFFFR